MCRSFLKSQTLIPTCKNYLLKLKERQRHLTCLSVWQTCRMALELFQEPVYRFDDNISELFSFAFQLKDFRVIFKILWNGMIFLKTQQQWVHSHSFVSLRETFHSHKSQISWSWYSGIFFFLFLHSHLQILGFSKNVLSSMSEGSSSHGSELIHASCFLALFNSGSAVQ